MVTIDEAIEFLQKAKNQIGGNKPLVLSLTDSELPDTHINALSIAYGYVEVQCEHPVLAGAGVGALIESKNFGE